MGFFNKLKNMVTGGGATVKVEVEEAVFGAPFKVKVKAVVGETDLEIAGVYLKVAGIERVTIKDVEVAPAGESTPAVRRDVEASEYTFQTQLSLAGAQKLVARGGYDWETEVTLPPQSQPSYAGINATHEWKVLGGLSAPGNDPDSGWVAVRFS
ncbi:MAG TPA: hypothetical protein PK636_04325 [bacterium]|nr:hypothetical protein [bacterium]HPJ71891.1 hypothetical protein [bacterium]HPQ66844.1 hypothetical protein [bacterium]